jgi:subtilisin family serine protease
MNLLRKTGLMAGICYLLVACQDKETAPAESTSDDCLPASRVSGRVIEGQYIVAYTDAAMPAATASGRVAAQSASLLRAHRIGEGSVIQSFSGGVHGFVARLSDSQAAELQADPAVAQVEPDRMVSICSCFTVVEPRSVTWNIQRVGYGDGTGKTAWIIDTGVDMDHPDLNVDQQRSRSFISGQTSAEDENGHGTHVAGVIGARNNRIGTLGVASEATIVALKVLDQVGEGSLSNVISALAHVNRNGKAGDVVNMSLGLEETSDILDRAVRTVADKGILFAIAAGNDSKRAVDFSPGRVNHRNVFTVSAIDSSGNWARFSNYGNEAVDFAAPGVRIPSTYLRGMYARLSGTSMAAPHVAGILLLSGNQIRTNGFARNDPDGSPDPIASK